MGKEENLALECHFHGKSHWKPISTILINAIIHESPVGIKKWDRFFKNIHKWVMRSEAPDVYCDSTAPVGPHYKVCDPSTSYKVRPKAAFFSRFLACLSVPVSGQIGATMRFAYNWPSCKTS